MVVVGAEMEERGELANKGSQAGVIEFDEWLEQRLDAFGADGRLYLRCVQSILRQSRDDVDVDAEREERCTKSTTSCADDKWLTGTRAALVELLRTIDGREDTLVIGTFVSEIMDRFRLLDSSCLASLDYVEQAQQQQCYDSIDSGVCPSPCESLQNYDQAFPPLAQADAWHASFLFPNDLLELQLSTSPQRPSPPYSQYAAHRSHASSVSSSASSSAKRKKIDDTEPTSNSGTRKIARSLPTAAWGDVPLLPKVVVGGFSLWASSATFAPPQPLFVVPRQVRTVAPRKSPPAAVMAGDVPFWPPPPSPFGQRDAEPAMDAANENAQLTAMFSENNDVQRWLTAAAEFCSVNTTTRDDAETGTLVEEDWFDAPRFALHIIGASGDDDERFESPQPTGAYATWSAGPDNEATRERKAPLGDFVGVFNVGGGDLLGVDAGGDVEFCLPKVGTVTSMVPKGAVTSKVGPVTAMVPPKGSVPSTGAVTSGGKAAFYRSEEKEEDEVVSYSIPISPTTHFVPIRSESMEDAYFPRPGFDAAAPQPPMSDAFQTMKPTDAAALRGGPLLQFRTINSTTDRAIQTCCPNELEEREQELDVVTVTPTQFALEEAATLSDAVWATHAAASEQAALLLWEQTTPAPCGAELLYDDASYEEQLLRYVSSISLMAPLVDDATDAASCRKGELPEAPTIKESEAFVVDVSPSGAEAAEEPVFRC